MEKDQEGEGRRERQGGREEGREEREEGRENTVSLLSHLV